MIGVSCLNFCTHSNTDCSTENIKNPLVYSYCLVKSLLSELKRVNEKNKRVCCQNCPRSYEWGYQWCIYNCKICAGMTIN